MKIPRFFAAGLAILLVCMGSASGQEQTFDKYNFAITPPGGWKAKDDLPPKRGLLATFVNPGKTATFSIAAENNDYAPAVLNDSFVREFNLLAEDAGRGALLSGTYVDTHGVRCYERKGAITSGSGTVSTFTQVMSANGIVYSLMGTRNDGSAAGLPEIRVAIDSFHFIKQPDAILPEPEKSEANKAGTVIGQNAVIIVPVSVVIIVIMLVVFIKRSSERKSRRGYRVRK